MKTATVRDLRDHYSKVLKWIDAGEDVTISRRGVVVARLVPEKATAGKIDWNESAALKMKKNGMRRLAADESASLIAEASGHW